MIHPATQNLTHPPNLTMTSDLDPIDGMPSRAALAQEGLVYI